MRALVKFVLAVSVLVSMSVNAGAKDGVMKEWSRRHAFVNPEQSGDAILHQWRGGQWQRAELAGVFRFFVTSSSNAGAANDVDMASKLYIQWLETKNGVEEVVFSISVDELNVQPRYRFGLPTCDELPACDAISLSVYDVYEGREQLFRVAIEGLGQYRFHL